MKKYYEIKAADAPETRPALAPLLRAIAGTPGAELDRIRAELETGTGSAGGYLIREQMFDEVVRLVAERSAFVQAGARMLVLREKTLPVPRVASLPQPAWRAEGGNVAESEPVFEAGELAPKSLACIVPVSRELLADGLETGELLVDALTTGVALAVDRAIFRGAGSASNEPLGLLNRPVLGVAGTAPAVRDWRHFVGQYWTLRGQQFPVMLSAWIMSADLAAHLDWVAPAWSAGGVALPAPDVLKPLQRLTSPALTPDDPGTEGYYSVMGDFTQLLIGWRETVEVRMLSELLAGTGKVAFLVHARVDIEMRNARGLTVMDGIELEFPTT